MDHHAKDSFLNETCGYHNENGRIKRDAYKGSNRSERVEVANIQKEQAEERQNSKLANMQSDAAFEAQTEMTRRQLIAMEREKQRTRRAKAEEMAQYNQIAQREQYDRLK